MSAIRIGPQGDERTRNYEVDGIKYHMVASDPYGFVKITCMKINKTLPGTYTSFLEAERAAKAHAITLNTKKKEA